MARPIGLSGSEEPDVISAVRTVATGGGGVIVADSATLSDANYPAAASTTTGGTITCRRFRTLWLNVELATGAPLTANTSITVEMLIRDDRGAADKKWKRLLDESGSPLTVTLDGTGFVEVIVAGRLVYPRISAVSGSISAAIVLLAFPGESYPS